MAGQIMYRIVQDWISWEFVPY